MKPRMSVLLCLIVACNCQSSTERDFVVMSIDSTLLSDVYAIRAGRNDSTFIILSLKGEEVSGAGGVATRITVGRRYLFHLRPLIDPSFGGVSVRSGAYCYLNDTLVYEATNLQGLMLMKE